MKHKIFLFALLLVAIFGSNRAMANEDIYPYIWKNEYKYLVDPTFHTVKFCNDYKNVLCVSDSTIEVLDAENGKSLRKKKYDFKNDMVEVSAKDNLIIVGNRGSFRFNLLDFTTLELVKSVDTKGWIFSFKFYQNNLLVSTTKGNDDNELITFDLNNYEQAKVFPTTYELHEIAICEKLSTIFFLNRYSINQQDFRAMLCSYNLITNEIKEIQNFDSYYKNLKLSPQENYLGCINDENSHIKIFDISDVQTPFEISEIDFESKVFSFSYDEKEIFYDLTYNIQIPKSFVFNLTNRELKYKLEIGSRGGIDVNDKNQYLTFSANEEGNIKIALRTANFLSSLNNTTKKNLIETPFIN